MCVHLIFSGGQGRALAQNTIKVRYITIWYSAGVLTLCETTGVLVLCETTANTILVGVPSARARRRAGAARAALPITLAHQPTAAALRRVRITPRHVHHRACHQAWHIATACS